MAKDLTPITTPRGLLQWVNISGQGKLNYNEDGYNYVATIYIAGEPAQKLKAQIDELAETLPKDKKIKSLGYKTVYKSPDGNLFTTTANKAATEEDEATDMISFAFSTSVTWTDGKAKVIDVYNAKGAKVAGFNKKIGNNTEGAISGNLKPYTRGKECGISLFLNKVQIFKFIEYTEDSGFAAEEGDFEGDTDTFEAQPVETAKPVEKAAATSTVKPRL
jgi:hypothetical protein